MKDDTSDEGGAKDVFDAIRKKVEAEPYARMLGIELVELEQGRAVTKMKFSERIENVFGMAHGGAIFSLIDEAFGAAANSYGTVALALNVNVTYIKSPSSGDVLYAEAEEVSRTNRISTCHICVKNGDGDLIATSQAMAYRKRDIHPFL